MDKIDFFLEIDIPDDDFNNFNRERMSKVIDVDTKLTDISRATDRTNDIVSSLSRAVDQLVWVSEKSLDVSDKSKQDTKRMYIRIGQQRILRTIIANMKYECKDVAGMGCFIHRLIEMCEYLDMKYDAIEAHPSNPNPPLILTI